MRTRRAAIAFVAAALTVLSGCLTASPATHSAGTGTGTAARSTGAAASGSPESVPIPSPQSLEAGLLSPMDLFILGLPGMLITDANSGGDRAAAGSRFDVTFLGGDPSCTAVLSPHAVPPASWAWVLLATPVVATEDFVVVGDEIDAFHSRGDADEVMQQQRTQSATCHSFTGQFEGSPPLTFTYSSAPVAGLGDDAVASELTGVSADGNTRFTSEMIDIRRGCEVLFVQLIGPHATPETIRAVAARAVLQSTDGG